MLGMIGRGLRSLFVGAATRPVTTVGAGVVGDIALNGGGLTMGALGSAFSAAADATGLGDWGLGAVAAFAGAGLLLGGGISSLAIAAGVGAAAWGLNNTETGQQLVASLGLGSGPRQA